MKKIMMDGWMGAELHKYGCRRHVGRIMRGRRIRFVMHDGMEKEKQQGWWCGSWVLLDGVE